MAVNILDFIYLQCYWNLLFWIFENWVITKWVRSKLYRFSRLNLCVNKILNPISTNFTNNWINITYWTKLRLLWYLQLRWFFIIWQNGMWKQGCRLYFFHIVSYHLLYDFNGHSFSRDSRRIQWSEKRIRIDG